MRNLFTIWRRELAACFLSPIAYVTIVMFLSVAGGTFVVLVLNGRDAGLLPVMLFESVILWLPVLITVISMRLFAEEKRSGTIETLMTAPVTEAEVVLGKYAGAVSFLILVVMPAIGDIFILKFMSPGVRSVDVGAILGGALILLLLSSLCVSIGLFVSLLTKNQIVAAVLCMCVVWCVILFGWILSTLPLWVDMSRFADYISATTHIQDFARGLIDVRTVILYVSGTLFMLFVSVRVLESRRWR